DDAVYDLLVSPRIVEFAYGRAVLGEPTAIELGVGDDGEVLTLTARSATQSLTVAADPRPYPNVEEVFASELAASGAWATTDADAMRELLQVARRHPAIDPDDEDDDPLFWLGVVDGEGIVIDIRWPGLGLTTFQMGTTAEGSRIAALPPGQLADALIGLDGEITVVVPDLAHHAIRVSSAARDALIMPIQTTFERMRFSTEQVLTEVFGPSVLARDPDGHYRLDTDDVAVFARLVDDEPVRIQVFAIAVDGVEASAELFTELNDHNARIGFARCFWLNDQVLVECDLMAGTTEAAELHAAHERVLVISRELGPMLAAVFGGTAASTTTSGADPTGSWADYLRTVVEAELVEGTLTTISEGGAWPYPGTVWALTSDNPMGERRSDEENESARPELLAAATATGAKLHRSVGTSIDTGDAETGLVVWDTDRTTVLELARRFRQEAVFEIDEDEVRVIACFEDRV
ncbi:MAG: DUF3293 domain-containing protein, partial [Actinobacteria bacterium]|nr:DUF3293 domain-containing protein [Actinomycetota bacterium]